MLRNRCQQLIAAEHAHSQAIGTVDETGTTKSGNHTCGVKRQYNGNRGKIENCVTAILDRFLHHSEIITFSGQSFRLRHRNQDSKPATDKTAPTGTRKKPTSSKPAKAPTGSAAE